MACAGQTDNSPNAQQHVITRGQDNIRQLDTAIDRILSQRKFAWRLPREKQVEVKAERKGWLWDTLHWLGNKIEAFFQTIDRWLDAFAEWLRNKLPGGEAGPKKHANRDTLIRIAFYIIGAGLVILLLLLVQRRLRAHQIARKNRPGGSPETVIDLDDEAITADDLPQGRWLALAREMVARRKFRKAMRAYYLSILAQLGDQGRVVIAGYKSNRDYLGELSRRSHVEPELPNLFDRCVTGFEHAWYGMHPVAEDQLAQFVHDQERIARLVRPAT